MRAAAAQIEIQEEYGWRYEGQVNRVGKRQGKGVSSWGNGYRYEGEWRNCLRHGHGTCTHTNGHVESGQWNHGDFLG